MEFAQIILGHKMMIHMSYHVKNYKMGLKPYYSID